MIFAAQDGLYQSASDSIICIYQQKQTQKLMEETKLSTQVTTEVKDTEVKDQVEKPRLKRKSAEEDAPEPQATKKAVVVTESEALGKSKTDFIQMTKRAAAEYLKIVNKELDGVDVGHPHYSNLKFARIRAERIIFSCEELQRGKGNRA